MKKHTLEHIKEEYKKHGCELLDLLYKNNRTKMKFKCSCGNIYHKSFDNFQVSPRCRRCANKAIAEDHKHNPEEVKQFFANNKCELLEGYKDTRLPIKYKCECGNVSKISFDNFKHGKRCQQCKKNKLSGKNHWNWKSNRHAIQEAKTIRKKCYKAVRSTIQKIGTIKNDKVHNLLGYTPADLQKHLSQFSIWPTLQNGQWHLDHIFPIQAFIDFNIIDIKLINCLDNLQPLTPKDNLSKNDTYDASQFKKWLIEKASI